MTKDIALLELKTLIKENEEKILPTKWYPEGVIGASYYVNRDIYYGWHTKTITLLRLILPEDSDFLEKFISLKENRFSNASSAKAVLESLIEAVEREYISIKEYMGIEVNSSLATIFSRFHKVVRQLRNRYENRNTLDVNDEYDVQDLLHALLKLYFDDVRAEEWTPTYAGKAARMDFLLKNEQIVIEVKKTRRGLTDKELGDQLIVDVDRYKIHPDCKQLICFIYDPEGRVGNPTGLCKDLNDQHNGFAKVIIDPIL